MVTLRELETNEQLNHFTQGAIKESVRHIVGVQFRNLATLVDLFTEGLVFLMF